LAVRLAENKIGLFGQPGLYMALTVLYLALLGSLGWWIGTRREADT
jgi:hypothetical protein